MEQNLFEAFPHITSSSSESRFPDLLFEDQFLFHPSTTISLRKHP